MKEANEADEVRTDCIQRGFFCQMCEPFHRRLFDILAMMSG